MSTNDRNLTDLTELTAPAITDWLYTVRPGSPNLPRKIRAGNLLGNLLGFTWINVTAPIYGAVGDNVTENYTALQAALNAVSSTLGGVVYVPRGQYRYNTPLVINKRTILMGDGMLSSVLIYTGVGDGVQSTWPINSSTPVWISVRDIAIAATNAANAGGGFADVGGSYVSLDHVYVEGFKHQVIFDQTEIASIESCELNMVTAIGRSGLWLVNGDDHTALASQGYTNNISVRNTQFLGAGAGATAYDVRDDGGGQHEFDACNFDGASAYGVYAAGVGGLRITNCASEGHLSGAVLLDESSFGSDYVGPCRGVDIEQTGLTDTTTYEITLNAGYGIRIIANPIAGYSTNAINIASDKVTQLTIADNAKLLIGASRNGKDFLPAALSVQRLSTINYMQNVQTYVATGHAGGAQTCTPAGMGNILMSDGIRVGRQLLCVNADGTNSEIVVVTAVAATTFTATFASSKAANFLVLGTKIDVAASGRVGVGQSNSFVDGKNHTIANNGVAQVANTVGAWGILLVLNGTSGELALFALKGGAHATAEISDPGGVFSVTAGTAGTNIYWSAGNARYEIENKTGAQVVYNVALLAASTL